MPQDLKLKIKGLYTSYNDLSEVPDGALLKARNIDILQDSLATPRRGFDQLTGAFSDPDERALQIEEFGDKLIAYTDDNKLYYYDSSTWNNITGTYSPPDASTRLRFSKANQNLYFTTSAGVYKLDVYNGTPVLAGAFKALDLELSITNTLATWLADDFRVAYRAVLGYKDANDNLILGAPSQRSSIKNTAGAGREVTAVNRLPTGVTTDYFLQLYRSSQIDNSATSTEPSDELQLVYEVQLTSTDITNGYATVVDIVDDALRGAVIYTAGTQQGLAQQNERPPYCKDLTEFKGFTFFANLEFVHRYNFTVISTSALANDEIITIDSIAYTAKASETIASGFFLRQTSGSIAENIRATAESLVRVINGYASSTVWAFYTSGPNDIPGKILIEDRTLGTAGFAVTSDAASTWTSPVLPSSGTTQSSENDKALNGISFSKQNQPEAAPLPNIFFAGSKDEPINRIISIKDSLFVLKDDGIFKIFGQNANDFSITEFDKTVRLIAPESAVVLANNIFCLTDQGVVSISETGVSIRSRPIEQNILSLVSNTLATTTTEAFGVAYNQDRKYYIFLPTTSADTYPTQAFVYNLFTDTWVRHVLSVKCGFVDGDGFLYLGDATSEYLLKERKNYSFLDYVDYGFATTISTITDTVLEIAAGTDNTARGDVIFQTSTLFATVTAVDTIAGTITINTDPGLTLAACTILKAIDAEIQWAPIVTGNAGVQKQFYSAKLIFKQQFNGDGNFTFESGFSATKDSVMIEGGDAGQWGLFNWGESPWGGDFTRKENRQWVPRSKQRASLIMVGFEHAWGYSPWELVGVTLFSSMGGGETVR